MANADDFVGIINGNNNNDYNKKNAFTVNLNQQQQLQQQQKQDGTRGEGELKVPKPVNDKGNPNLLPSFSQLMIATRESVQRRYPHLINEAAYDRLIAGSHRLPINGFVSTRFNYGYEMRMGKDNSVDMAIFVECTSCLKHLLLSEDYLYPYVKESDVWRRLLKFLSSWKEMEAAMAPTTPVSFSSMWLEVDIPEDVYVLNSTGNFTPLPNIFLVSRDLRKPSISTSSSTSTDLDSKGDSSFNDVLSFLNNSTLHLIDSPLSSGMRATLWKIYNALPPDSLIFTFGLLIARKQSNLIRMEIEIIPNTPKHMIKFLKDIDWPGDIDDVSPLIEEMYKKTCMILLAFDVGDDGVKTKMGVLGFNLNPEPAGRPTDFQSPNSWEPLVNYICNEGNKDLFDTTPEKCGELAMITQHHPYYRIENTVNIDSSLLDIPDTLVNFHQKSYYPNKFALTKSSARITHIKFVYTGKEKKPFEVKFYLELRQHNIPPMQFNNRIIPNQASRVKPPTHLKSEF